MINQDNAEMPKPACKFICDKCSFKCSKRSNFLCHLKTMKHVQSINDNKSINIDKPVEYSCKCGNIYKYMSGLSRHKKTCKKEPEEPVKHISNTNAITTECVAEMFVELLKDNREFNHMILELIKNHTSS